MRSNFHLAKFRFVHPQLGIGDGWNGAFHIPCRSDGKMLTVLQSNGLDWEHVSVSRPDRSPTWNEMSAVKDLFFDEDETVMQLHVPKKDHVNFHPYCLHLWKPIRLSIPVPPFILVGPKTVNDLRVVQIDGNGRGSPSED